MDPVYLLVFAAVMVGTAKGGLSTVGSVAVPLVALVMNPVVAAATLLPVYIVTDWVGVALYRRTFSLANLKILVPAMLLGIAIATVMVTVAPEALLLIITGLIGLWYCLRSWLRRRPPVKTGPALVPGLAWGTLAGIASYLTHSAGPPTQAYLLPQRMPKLEYAGTVAITFAFVNLSKLPGYALAGQFDDLDWSLIPWLILAGVGGTALGSWLTEILPEAIYVRVIEVFLFLLSIILLAKGTAALLA
ncbi:hypothetical membrane protein [Pseudooceanicola batsensis HTCC2597]|uniref:Probable membrane transporter protein n=1 Tax=Pseudooceanicola batsensis (strain ATCC BAA-863 / DSM 15984 / KCTC 12145 / HTCC2597) TaxID=252305 RepID=A3TT95_PSEBH|nr:sulfite exporter TauE/SafE family protein [Pseudooceanicola batsensis]EAQ04872.1 hypothetical membrane protein [Pseudooceanicola batsensis HTCC2597]